MFLLEARFKLKGTSLWTKVREIMLTRSSETAMIRVHLFSLDEVAQKEEFKSYYLSFMFKK